MRGVGSYKDTTSLEERNHAARASAESSERTVKEAQNKTSVTPTTHFITNMSFVFSIVEM